MERQYYNNIVNELTNIQSEFRRLSYRNLAIKANLIITSAGNKEPISKNEESFIEELNTLKDLVYSLHEPHQKIRDVYNEIDNNKIDASTNEVKRYINVLLSKIKQSKDFVFEMFSEIKSLYALGTDLLSDHHVNSDYGKMGMINMEKSFYLKSLFAFYYLRNNPRPKLEEIGWLFIYFINGWDKELRSILIEIDVPEESNIEPNNLKHIQFKNQYEIVLFYEYSGIFAGLYEKLKSKTATWKAIASMLGIEKQAGSIEKLAPNMVTGSKSKQMYSDENIDRVAELLEFIGINPENFKIEAYKKQDKLRK